MRLISLFLLLLSLSIGQASTNQQHDTAIAQADSLFKAKKYTESFEIYQHLLEVENLTSPAMLLKMAFIKEGLNDYTNALYYINLYYLQSGDRKALDKMEEIAAAKDLQGYEFGDFEFGKTIFFKYFNPLIIFLFCLSLLLVGLMMYRKRKYQTKPFFTAAFSLIVLALLFYAINYGKHYNKAIVSKNNTYIMNGPSAGAEVLAIIKKGHRLPIKGEQDVWTMTQWDGTNAYIKSDKLKKISFL